MLSKEQEEKLQNRAIEYVTKNHRTATREEVEIIIKAIIHGYFLGSNPLLLEKKWDERD